jgi:hypothetical protein
MAAACAPAICQHRPIRSTPRLTPINAGVAQDFRWSPDYKPATVRFDVVNLFDQIYELRDGSGIGVFAPQFGARRGYYVGHFAEASR